MSESSITSEKLKSGGTTKSYDESGTKRKIDAECFTMSDSSSDSIENFREKSPILPETEQEILNEKLYGLKPAFLKSLGINPPLDRWIHVANFRCDKNELKEVLELAGRVIICSVIANRERYAKAMYSHPLEAIQAVSMLDGQTFYGQKLKITLTLCPTDTVILPKGLNNIGRGLGVKGKPLTDIVDQYKRFINRKESQIDPFLFLNSDTKALFAGSKVKESSSDINEKDKENNDFSRSMYFNMMNVEDLQDLEESAPPIKKAKIDSENDSLKFNDKNTKDGVATVNVKKNESIPIKNTSVQSEQPFRNLKVIPLNSSSPSEHARPTGLHAKSFSTGNPPGVNDVSAFQGVNMGSPINPRMNIAAMGTQNYNIGSVPPRMVHPSGPQGVGVGPSGPQGMTMDLVGPPGVNLGPPVPIRMNAAPGPAPMNMNIRPSGYGPSNAMQPITPQGPHVPLGMGTGLPAVGPTPLGMGPAQHAMGPVTRQVSPAPVPTSNTFSLQFSNLPPSTTFPLLCEKVSLCGSVLSLQLTTPGCAVARFSQRAHAERCFQVFNGLRIDGFVIEVRHI